MTTTPHLQEQARDRHRQEQAKALHKIAIAAVIGQYGGLEILDSTKQDLKQRVKRLIHASLEVQSWFINNPQATPQHRQFFKREYNKDEGLMLSEVLSTLFGLDADSLEEINNTLKQHIQTV